MSYSLRWYQRDACSAAWQSLCTSPGNPVVVLPTGSGKSIVIAELCRAAIQDYTGRVIVLAHRKELLEQNAAKIQALLPFGVTCGLFSAGLKMNSTEDQVIVAGIQSAFKKAEVFGARHLVLIDEVHLVPHDGEGMYRTFLNDLRAINPRLRMVGFTATPFRTDCGSLCRADGLFQRVCFDAPVQQLISEGFLCPVTNQTGMASVNTSGLHVRGGEFVPGEVERLFDQGDKIGPAVKEIVNQTAGRRSVLLFCSGVNHAEHVAQAVEKFAGEQCGIVTGLSTSLERAAHISRFRSGALRFLCNVDVLTTGFDAPGIDCIAVLRATMSPGLFAQICGRGLRTAPGKDSCLILDFGENLKRHGPIDAIEYGKKKEQGNTSAPEKQCPACGESVSLGAVECPCGWRFPREPRMPNHGTTADGESQILAEPKRWIVISVEVRPHRKKKDPSAPPTLRVDYVCEPADTRGNISEQVVSEWICLEHPPGFARAKARAWWAARSNAPAPETVEDAVSLWRRGAVATPTTLTTLRDGHFYRIVEQSLDPAPESWSDEEAETWETEEVGF